MDSLFLKSEVLLASYWQIIHSKDIICHFTCSYIKNMIFETVFLLLNVSVSSARKTLFKTGRHQEVTKSMSLFPSCRTIKVL